MQEKLIDLLINNTFEVLLAVLNYLKIVSEEYLFIKRIPVQWNKSHKKQIHEHKGYGLKK